MKTLLFQTMEKYVTPEDRWQRCSSMPTARWDLMLAAAGGRLYALGGIAGTGNNRRTLDAVEAYDPRTDSWQFFCNMPERRHGAAVAALDERVYVISGKIAAWPESSASERITERVDCLNPTTKTWSRLTDIPTGRVGAKAIVAHGLIFVVGGIGRSGEFPTAIDVFDPRSNEWRAGPVLARGRSGHMCAIVDEQIIVLGGGTVAYGAGKPSICTATELVSVFGYPKP